jgi:hypothetical protein
LEKKAQTALEYFMTYGFAILTIIVVGAALYAIGMFSPVTYTGERSTGFSGFEMEDFKFNTTSAISLSYSDKVGKSVTLQIITAIYKGKTCSNATMGAIPPVTLNPTVTYNTTLDCNVSFGAVDQPPKSSYTIVVYFNYTDPDSSMWYYDTGILFGTVN